jgi:transposase
MRRSEALQGVRVIKFTSILGRYEAAELNQIEAAELLGIDERTFRRWRQRFEDDGEAGLLDRRLGKASGRRVPIDREHEVEALYRERYSGFTAKHFHEQLVTRHNFAWSYTWTKTFLHSKGLLEKAARRGAHRRKRPRRPMPGMMLHQDGSRHVWLQGLPALDLIVTMDDATSAIYSAFVCEEEGTASTFRALREVFSEHGLPLSLYTDRGAHYFHTAQAGAPVDRKQLTQVGRALERLGVEHIAAYSPQARGRCERVFQTLQDRLVKELGLAGIETVEAANTFLREVYIPAHNARFAVAPEQPGTGFVAIPGVDLDEVLCVQEERQVGNDNCVSYNRLKLQIPESPLRPHFVKARVKVRTYADGMHAVFHGPRCLGRYDAEGRIVAPSRTGVPDPGKARVAEGRNRLKAGLRPPPPAASALTRSRPSAVGLP